MALIEARGLFRIYGQGDAAVHAVDGHELTDLDESERAILRRDARSGIDDAQRVAEQLAEVQRAMAAAALPARRAARIPVAEALRYE